MEIEELELGDVDMIKKSVKSLLNLVTVEQDSRNNASSPSIYMAPDILRDLSPSSFKPKMVSIGPLHRGDENLQAFEGQKVSCLTNLLGRINVPRDEILRSCMEEVYNSMERIKACYVWTQDYNESEIAEMMVMDACFILEFICWYSLPNKSYSVNNLLSQTVIFDLVLLENQIPFFILDQIYHCTILKEKCTILQDLNEKPGTPLTKFFHRILGELNLFHQAINIDNIPTNDTPHILSLLHEYYKPPSCIIPVSSSSSLAIHSAGDLARAGVIFKSNQDPQWEMQMDVTFSRLPCGFGSWRKPTVRIPILCVHDFTEVILRNLIAFELSYQTGNYITSYACAMDMLVNTPEDVTKLVESGVLVNDLGSNEEAADLINNICKNVTSVDSFYDQQWKTLIAHCNANWPKYIVRLKRNYFNSPWSIIGLGAGIVLFILTLLQTIYTIKAANK